MAAYHPHPALKVTVPMNPMVDGWMGDDWFHNGAFRQQNMSYIYEQVGTRSNDAKWWSDSFDDYDLFMKATSAGNLGKIHGLEQTGFWRQILAHPSYDSWWQQQAVDKLLAAEPLTVPMMLVHSLWDQEDIYGAIAVYKALKPKDTNNDKVFLVMGPWHHGQEIEEASTLGAIHFGSATGPYFMKKVLLPFLDHYLKDVGSRDGRSPRHRLRNRQQRVAQTRSVARRLRSQQHLHHRKAQSLPHQRPSRRLDRTHNQDLNSRSTSPTPPSPYPSARAPRSPSATTPPLTWAQWLVDDQREPGGRTDVLSYISEPLTEPLKISGQPVVRLTASTSGTDSDWVVKLIDVYPDEVAAQPELGRLPATHRHGHLPWPLPREPRRPQTPRRQQAPRLPLGPAHHQPRLPTRPPHHGAGAIQLVPPLRPQPTDLRAEHLQRSTKGLRKATQRIYHSPGRRATSNCQSLQNLER